MRLEERGWLFPSHFFRCLSIPCLCHHKNSQAVPCSRETLSRCIFESPVFPSGLSSTFWPSSNTIFSLWQSCTIFFSGDISASLLCSPQGTLGLSIGVLAVQRRRDNRDVPEASGALLGSRLPPNLPSPLLFRPKNCWRCGGTHPEVLLPLFALSHTTRPGPWF